MKNTLILLIFVSAAIALPFATVADEPSPHQSFAAINKTVLSGEVGTTRMIGPNGFDQEVTYVEHGDFGLFEGDIMVPLSTAHSAPDYQNGVPSDSIVINGFLWPNNTVPYFVGGVSAKIKSDFRQAVADIAAVTDIEFVELTNTNNAPYYIKVVTSVNSCTSFVGYRIDLFGAQGFQELALFDDCGVATATHEILHALGMYHEQSRSDRDNFVQVITANIIPDLLFNFDKITSGATDVGPYDYDSIMHYPFWAFNINNDFETETLVSRTSTPVSFFNFVLSPGDIASLNLRYPPIEEPENTSFISAIMLLLFGE